MHGALLDNGRYWWLNQSPLHSSTHRRVELWQLRALQQPHYSGECTGTVNNAKSCPKAGGNGTSISEKFKKVSFCKRNIMRTTYK